MRHFTVLLTACIAGLFWFSDAQAQLVLPGAAAPTPAGATPAPAAAGGGAQKKPAKKKSGESAGGPESGGVSSTKAPGEESLAGRQFQRNGSTGLLALERPGKTLELSKLILIGYQITKPNELCRVELGGARINLKPDRRYQGLITYQAELEACPFALDVLDGAVRIRGKTCEFKAADCNADPSGIWGPPGASIGPEEAKNIEKLRGKADKDARAGFRAVLNAAGRDKVRTREVARDQASFSSVREESCRDYAQEDKHGFCASRVTLARAVALSAELHPDAKPDADTLEKPRLGSKKKPRVKPATFAAPAQPLPGVQ